MTQFSVPAAHGKVKTCINYFGGCDLTNSPSSVPLSRSPCAPNILRDVPGKVRKMQGYKTLFTADGAIHGCFVLGNQTALLHAGTKLYHITNWDAPLPTPCFTQMANAQSRAVFLGESLYLFDGQQYLVWSAGVIKNVSQCAKIPKVTIAGTPQGGGGAYEELNLLTPKYCETFVGTADAKVYHLSHTPLDAAAVTVRIQNADKTWRDAVEGTAFSVNRQTGEIYFVAPPGAPPVAGEPNVEITAAHTVPDYAARILTARAVCAFGVNGVEDRVFAAGSAQYPNRDYYSAQNDATYFGDHSYCVLGGKEAIEGYSLLDGYLIAHKNTPYEQGNLILRAGNLIDGQAAFPITASLAGPGLVASASLGMLEGEPLYLSKQGVMAVTRTETDGSRFAQCRSFYLNGGMLAAAQAGAYAAHWQDFYVLALGGKLWFLDGLQPTPRAQGMPWSARQYEGYYRENCAATVLWQQDDRLFFGTQAGAVCRFCAHTLLPNDYCDNDTPVKAHWDLPDFGGATFYKNKAFAYLAVRLAAAPVTGVCVSARCKGVWQTLLNDKAKAGYLSFSNLVFSKLTFRCDTTPRTIGTRVRLKKADKACFRLENAQAEPFGITEVALEYTENGNFK